MRRAVKEFRVARSPDTGRVCSLIITWEDGKKQSVPLEPWQATDKWLAELRSKLDAEAAKLS